jgi:hypothetical protein
MQSTPRKLISIKILCSAVFPPAMHCLHDTPGTGQTRPSYVQGGPPDAPQPPERDPVPVSIKTVQLDGNTKLLQCHCSAHLRFEAEYGRKRGTTSNAYLLLDGTEGMLVDVPRKEYLEVFCALRSAIQDFVMIHDSAIQDFMMIRDSAIQDFMMIRNSAIQDFAMIRNSVIQDFMMIHDSLSSQLNNSSKRSLLYQRSCGMSVKAPHACKRGIEGGGVLDCLHRKSHCHHPHSHFVVKLQCMQARRSRRRPHHAKVFACRVWNCTRPNRSFEPPACMQARRSRRRRPQSTPS